MRRELIVSPPFAHALKRICKYNSQAGELIRQAMEALAEDAFAPRLKTHRLKGKLKDYWACSAGYDLRISFRFDPDPQAGRILLIYCGTHEQVY